MGSGKRLGLVATLCAAGAVAVPAAASAQATSYGANLNRPANAGFDCTRVPSPIPTFFFSTGQTTCTYVPTSATGEGTATPFPGGAGQSQTFTPRANATTSVDVRLPVENTIDPAFGQTVDYMAISVLAPNVDIPASGSQGLGGSLAFFPQITPQDADSGRLGGRGGVPATDQRRLHPAVR